MKKVILVTGGAGYIGSHTVVELISSGYSVVVLDNLSNSSKESLLGVEDIVGESIEFVEGDVLDEPMLQRVFSDYSIDTVLHFAGLKSVDESISNPIDYYEKNVSGTVNLCKVMARNNVFNIIFSSSATVYGEPACIPIDEEADTGSTTNPYGTSKYIVERILKGLPIANESWRVVILRYFNPVGAHKSGFIGERPNGIPNNLLPYISKVGAGDLEFLSVFGGDYDTPDGTGVRDYIHVVDLAKGHLAALRYLEENSGLEAFNLGTGRGYSVLEVIRAFENASGIKVPYKIVNRRPGDIAQCFSNPSKAKRKLAWTAKLGLKDIMEDAWRWQTQSSRRYKK